MPGYKKVSHCPTCQCNGSSYELFNKIDETGDSIFSVPFEETPNGRVYIDEEKMDEMIEEQLDKRLGPKHDVLTEDDD